MKMLDINIDLIKKIAANNYLDLRFPAIVVFRHTAPNAQGDLQRVLNTGTNLMDVVVGCDADGVKVLGQGRSIPHTKYLEEQAQGKSNCNYVESQYQPQMWVRGNHLGYTGLVQHGSTLIHRTRDAVLGNADDYIQYGAEGRVGNNCHGYAPFSAGCTTLNGNMSKHPGVARGSTADWAAFEAWFAAKPEDTVYAGLWLEFDDLNARPALRIGSRGAVVTKLQTALKLGADGVFGPQTFLKVKACGVKDGIVTQEFAAALGVGLEQSA